MQASESVPAPHRSSGGSANGSGSGSTLPYADLICQAFQLRSQLRYALHPVEAALQYHRAPAEIYGEESHGGDDFAEAEAHYRAGAQGLRISEIPQLPQKLCELSRLLRVDREGRKSLRKWAVDHGKVIDEVLFCHRWERQGRCGGAEHHVYYESDSGRWFKRLYYGVNSSTLGDYLARMRLHAVLFPETAYRLEGFTINPKNKDLAPVVSQPHVEVDTTRPLVTKAETDDLMAAMGFAPVQLVHDGIRDDGYFAYLHPVTGVLTHDLHDQNVVRIPESGALAVIDPYISLARLGTWAAIKLAEVGFPTPPDEPFS